MTSRANTSTNESENAHLEGADPFNAFPLHITMKVSISTPGADKVIELDVEVSMSLGDLKALIEVEVQESSFAHLPL